MSTNDLATNTRLLSVPTCMTPFCYQISLSHSSFLPTSLTKEVMVDDRLVTMQVRHFPRLKACPRALTFATAMGHRRSGALPVAWCRFLSWRGLLRTGLRREQFKVFRHFG